MAQPSAQPPAQPSAEPSVQPSVASDVILPIEQPFKQPLRASSILPPIQSAFTTGLQSGGFPQPSGYATASEFLPISLQPPSSRLSSSALPLDQPEYAVIPLDQAAQ